jgi:hypothetical protein
MHAHAEFRKGAEESHLLGDDLTGTQKGNRILPMRLLDLFHPMSEHAQGTFPIDRNEAAMRISKQGTRRAVLRVENGQRLPTFWTSHSLVHWVILGGGQCDRVAVLEMDIQAAPGGTKAAYHRTDGVGLQFLGHQAKPEISGHELDLFCQLSMTIDEER